MRLIKPSRLAHRDEHKAFEVFSLDVSCDGRRLVTGGLDSKVKVWGLPKGGVTKGAQPRGAQPPAPEAQPPSLLEANKAKQGAKEESEAGQHEAAEPVEVPKEPVEVPQEPTEAPQYPLLSTMSSHTGAVTAVRFSPDGRYIASGSDDRIVLVSELDRSRQPRMELGAQTAEHEVWTPRKRLVGHDNDVQDLAWSPDGQLLVSVGLDSAIIVWSGQTFEKLNRLDWHNSHVKGVCFDPANKFFVTCSDDRSARIVRYSRASPTELSFSVEAVVQHAFVDSPLTSYFRRCSWSPDGECIACPNATNGPIPTVAIIERGQWQLQPRQQTSLVGHEGTTEVAKFSPRMYAPGACVVATAGEDGCVAVWSTLNPRPLCVVQNVANKLITDLAWSPSGEQLYCSSLDGSVVIVDFGSDLGAVLPIAATQARLEKFGATDLMDIPQSVEQLQVASTLASGEGASATTAENANTATTAENANTANATTATTANATTANATSANANATVTTAAPANAPAAAATTASAPAPAPAPTSDSRAPPRKQKTTITKDGRKRIAPVLLNSPSAPEIPKNISNYQQNTAPGTNLPFDRPSSALPAGGITTLVIGNKRRQTEDEEKQVAINPSTAVSQIRLSTPRVVAHISSDPSASEVLEARNGARPGDPTRVQVLANGKVVFVDYISEYACLLAGCAERFWAVCTDTGVLYLYTPMGSHLLPPIVLGAPPSILESCGRFLAALSATGMLFAFDLELKRALFPPQSIAPCLDLGQRVQDALVKGPRVSALQVTNEGEVLLATSTGSVFHFDKVLLCWQRVSSSFYAYGSRFWDSTASRRGRGPLAVAEQLTNEEALLRAGSRGRQLQRLAANRSAQAGFHGFERTVSLSHLSARVAAARALNSTEEVLMAVAQYARELAGAGDRLKLAELFRSLQGEARERALAVAAEYTGMQTLVVEYRDAL